MQDYTTKNVVYPPLVFHIPGCVNILKVPDVSY
jgi:hypothetical protein